MQKTNDKCFNNCRDKAELDQTLLLQFEFGRGRDKMIPEWIKTLLVLMKKNVEVVFICITPDRKNLNIAFEFDLDKL